MGDLIKVKVLDLRPTQFALGMQEVAEKVARLKEKQAKGEDALKEALKKEAALVVRGPGAELFLIDHHHFARAAWEAGLEKLYADVKVDWSEVKEDEFWKMMEAAKWVYLRDQFGKGRHKPSELPHDVRGMADDPYRSLAQAVRKAGGFEKSDHPFAEFIWADFFRSRVPIGKDASDFEKAVKKGVKLAQTAEAKGLPGGPA